MLNLHTSNQLEQLASQFSFNLNKPPNAVFAPEIVVVQNAGMARYLSMQHADSTGISANMEYLFPAEFMWKLLRLVSDDIPEESQCTPSTLRFHIMQELTEHSDSYPELHHYILSKQNADHIDDKASWDLSCELAQLLDQYLFYRSDWIQAWEQSPEISAQKDWQARLWLRCVTDKKLINWLALQDQFKDSLEHINKDILPRRISFFSMSSLSPGYIDLLGELGHKTELHFYMMNPCQNIYWGDILSEKIRSRLPPSEQDYTEVGNPLLASMGKQGRDFIHQLLSLATTNEQKTPEPLTENNSAKNLLSQIQQDIYHLTTPQLLADFQTEKDNSISINACHTRMREVEVLHDQILAALDADDSLAAADIVVMMPDIDNYAPYIEAIFSNNQFSNSQQKLPFSIADRSPLQVHSIIEALLKALMLADTRFDVESVFELLDYESIRTKFKLEEADVLKCRNLAKATNIRWGISATSRAQEDLPDTIEHTWKYALDRLLLGYTLGENPRGELFFETNSSAFPLLPFNQLEGSDAVMLAQFKQFTDALFKLQSWRNTNQTLAQWVGQTKTLLQSLFSEKEDITKILLSFNELDKSTRVAKFDQKIPFPVFHALLQESLEGISGSEKYLGYGITFCSLVPMRSVPFKVVVLMGMNDGEFPRQDKHHSFDLMHNKKRAGDRSRRDEDRYLFLESLLAARSRLIISFIGQDIKDNGDLPPSVLVSELLDIVTRYTGISGHDWICKHPLQAFSPRYFDGRSPLFSYANNYIALQKQDELPSQVFITERLKELDDSHKNISLAELIQFYQSPARYFLKHRFSIQTFDEDVTLPVREPFALESFKDGEIRHLFLEENDTDKLLIARAKGLLPYGDIGDHILQREQQIVEQFLAQQREYKQEPAIDLSQTFGDFYLQGEVNQITAEGRVIQQISKPFFRDYIECWIMHLALNTQKPESSLFFSPEVSFQLKAVEDAQQQLQQLLDYYWQGLHFPLMFFPKTSFNFIMAKGKENTKEATDTWEGSMYRQADKNKFENWLLHRCVDMSEDSLPEEFLETSRLIFGNMQTSLIEH